MKIIEDISYSIDDIINQIRQTFGFSYVELNDRTGYIRLDNKITLNLEFNEDVRVLDSAVVEFKSPLLDITTNTVTAEINQSCIESAIQIVDLISRMLGDSSNA